MPRLRQTATSALVLAALGASPWALPDARAGGITPSYGTQTVTIPLGNTTATGFSASPQIGVALATDSGFGATKTFTLDTGSTGVIVGPSLWTPPAGTPDLGPGSVTYSSSGVTHTGTWYQTQLLVGDANGNNITVSVPVLRVDPGSCGSDCTTAMFGVGFARESAGNTQGPGGTQRAVPANNPLLNVTAVNGAAVTASTPNQPGATGVNGNLTSGYIVGPNGLTVGLTAQNAAPFGMVPLTWNNQTSTQGYADWNPTPAWLSVNNVSSTGTVLNDTGITYAIVAEAGTGVGTNGNCGFSDCIDNGVPISVAIPQVGGAAAAYSYVVGAANAAAAAPPFTRNAVPSTGTFINTGLPFFNQYTYLYDYVNGQVGYIDRTAAIPAPGLAILPALLVFGLGARRRRQ